MPKIIVDDTAEGSARWTFELDEGNVMVDVPAQLRIDGVMSASAARAVAAVLVHLADESLRLGYGR